MSDLTVTEFVTARLGEWEEAARVDNESECWGNPYDEGGELSLILTPPRVLAQCAAMRIIVNRIITGDFHPDVQGEFDRILTTLASIWSDHPDWREGWR